MAFVPPLSMVLSGVLAIDQIWDVFVEMGKRGNAKMIGPFDERLSVTPHSLELSSSTYLTMLLQQFHALCRILPLRRCSSFSRLPSRF